MSISHEPHLRPPKAGLFFRPRVGGLRVVRLKIGLRHTFLEKMTYQARRRIGPVSLDRVLMENIWAMELGARFLTPVPSARTRGLGFAGKTLKRRGKSLSNPSA